ncbi:MAG: rod shape-determining protein MreD [Candidatus Saganbacteria bacterium]|nr:rod shape-determining protein MreD [Candidatus Saganbacteria bacterium]
MRFLKIAIYLLTILVLQVVVFSRLNIFGASPDLILVSVIILAVLAKPKVAILFAFSGGLLQDILSCGIYSNTLIKLVVAFLISFFKDNFSGDDNLLIIALVAIVSPLTLIIQATFVFWGKQIDLPYVVLRIVSESIYNLLFVFLLLPILRKIVVRDLS